MSEVKNCYTCKNRREIPGDAHSQCIHHKGPTEMIHIIIGTGQTVMGIEYQRYGYDQGWFFFPMNYDPIWMIKCDEHEQK